MRILRAKLSENLVLLTLVLFAFVSMYGMSMGMEIEDGQMSSCPFMSGQAAICTMNPLEHIASWQNMFTVLAQENILVFLAFASLIFFFVGRLRGASHIFHGCALYMLGRRIEIPIVLSPLQEAFLRGILHPKIF